MTSFVDILWTWRCKIIIASHDYVTVDGIAAGFNVALLSAISEAANTIFEPVMSNAASLPGATVLRQI